jgi:hypothetical protein
MASKITKMLLIGAVAAGLVQAASTFVSAWTLSPLASNDEKKDTTTFVSTTTGAQPATTTKTKSFWEKVGLSKSSKTTTYQSATPKRVDSTKKKKSWFNWGKSAEDKKAKEREDEEEDRPRNVVDWLGRTERPNL